MLQYKYDKKYIGTEKTCKEFEKAIRTFPQYISSEDVSVIGTLEDTEFYRYVGSLVTERLDYIYDEMDISLDKNYYLGKCDYEIEIEFKDYKKAERILELLSIIKTETQQMGKYSRFIKELQGLEK